MGTTTAPAAPPTVRFSGPLEIDGSIVIGQVEVLKPASAAGEYGLHIHLEITAGMEKLDERAPQEGEVVTATCAETQSGMVVFMRELLELFGQTMPTSQTIHVHRTSASSERAVVGFVATRSAPAPQGLEASVADPKFFEASAQDKTALDELWAGFLASRTMPV